MGIFYETTLIWMPQKHTDVSILAQGIAWHKTDEKSLFEPKLTDKYMYQHVNSLRPSDAYVRQ